MRTLRFKIIAIAAVLVVTSQIGTIAAVYYWVSRDVALAVVAFALLTTVIGAISLSRCVIQPVQTLLEATRRMRQGDYGERIQLNTNDELGILARSLNSMQDEVASREARTVFRARRDSLTGLHNREYVLQRMDIEINRASENNEHVAVMAIELNALEKIASALGHDIADTYVQQAANQLRTFFEPYSPLARIEGDTFLVILPGLRAEESLALGHQLIDSLQPGVTLPDVSVTVHPGIGIAIFPEHGEERDKLMLRATLAIDAGGVNASSHVSVYRPENEERRKRRTTILKEIRRAVRHETLELYYQPQISMSDGRICGAESLIRWNHPTLGRLSPADFIPIAEQSGNINVLTRWVITAAVAECRLWQEYGLDLSVSVNLSAFDLMDKDLPWYILDVLRNHDLDPRYLVAEITEDAVVHDFDHATAVLSRMRDLGVTISIDDFGTGYSSLSQLRNLPVDELKIDRTFVSHLPDNKADTAIVRAAVELAHSMNMSFVAEGVESLEALQWIRDSGADKAQGFYLSEALPADAFCNWVNSFANGAFRNDTKSHSVPVVHHLPH